jgi:hypothetical protein
VVIAQFAIYATVFGGLFLGRFLIYSVSKTDGEIAGCVLGSWSDNRMVPN